MIATYFCAHGDVHAINDAPDSVWLCVYFLSYVYSEAFGFAVCRVRVFDVRCGQHPVLTLRGHGGHVTSVQMDEWKAVSGR